MLDRYPVYYKEFVCTAGDCPDTCCAGWDVVVDEETAARYAAVEGELGQRLRQATRVDDDGDRVIAMVNGRCPLLRSDGLCQVQRQLGHEALCRVCREYPRLRQDYGAFVEHGLALSCPAAAALILRSRDDGWDEQGSLDAAPPEYDPALMALLQQTRPALLALLRDERRSVGQSLALALLYAYAVQDAMEGEPLVFDPAAELAALPPLEGGSLAPLVAFHQSLEILTPRWRAMLAGARVDCPGPWPEETRAVAAYYVNRYWLQAVSDRDAIWRVKQMLAACLMARLLPGTDAIALYSKEVEHDSDNVDRIWEAAGADPALSDRALLGWLLAD